MLEILTDPKVAPLIAMLPLLAFCWWMYYELTNNGESHIWWVGLLSRVKLADKGTTDYEHPVNASKLIFKWLGIVAGVLVTYQLFLVIQQYNPYIVGGPRPEKLTGAEGQPSKLPRRIPGAGGGGRMGGSAAPTETAPAAPGETPATDMGHPGMPQPAPMGSMQPVNPGTQPGMPFNPGGAPAGQGGGG